MSAVHPLICKQARIITHEMIRVLKLSLDRVASRRSAVIFRGQSRVGKSRCARFVADQLRQQYPLSHVTFHNALKRDSRRPNLYKDLCYTEKILPRERIDPFYHLLAYIEGLLAGQAAGQYVLVIDELQKLAPIDYFSLADLYNCLQLKDICLTLVGFAQPDIDHQVSSIKHIQQQQLVARFLTEILPFHGCRNVEELTAILRAYDHGSEFPVGSGTSYTAFFIPEAFAAGFRLTQTAELFWTELSDSSTGPYAKNIPMEHLCESVLNLLLRISGKDGAAFDFDSDLVSQAVHQSNLRTFCDAL